MKLLCYGVRNTEVPFFEAMNKNYNYELVLTPHFLNDESVHLAKGCDAVMLRGNCPADAKNLDIFKSYGIEYVITRTAGYNHIDLEHAKSNGQKVAYVPFYSPNAVAELSVSLALSLARHIQYTSDRTHRGNFGIDEFMFSKEIRKSTVGIIGLGRIGFTAAQLYKGLGANVIGYDVEEKNYLGDTCAQVSLETLLEESDIISIHTPYFKGSNDEFINKDKIDLMKDGVILVNVSRGEVQNIDDILNAVESGKIHGYATDVLKGEAAFFNKEVDMSSTPLLKRLSSLYPRVIVTPHVGSYTDEAVSNMVEVSYENLKELVETGTSQNQL